MIRPVTTAFAVIALCGLMACATSGSRPADIESVQLQLAETEKKIDQLTQRVTLIQMMVDSHQRTLQDMDGDAAMQSGSVATAPELSPVVDEIAPPAPDSEAPSAASEVESPAPETEKPVEPPPVSISKQPEPLGESGDIQTIPAPAKESIMVPEPNPIYQEAMKIFRNNDYETAGNLFETFAEQFPKDDLADNALYWAGECQYAQKNFGAAQKRFKQVLEAYPSGSKVPDALLKIGFTYISLGDRDTAIIYLKKVVSQYPFSAAGEKAEERLKTLQQ